MAVTRALSGGIMGTVRGIISGDFSPTRLAIARSEIVSQASPVILWTPEVPRGQRGPYLYVVGVPYVGVPGVVFLYWCPGCNSLHAFDHDIDSPSGKLQFDGNYELPTVDKLIKQESEGKCHHRMTAGVLEFQGSCWHDLKGENVPMVAHATVLATLDHGPVNTATYEP
jgi:hypothetical protein